MTVSSNSFVSMIYLVGENYFVISDWRFLLVKEGSVASVTMEFSFESFKRSPTVEALYTCHKSDLILVTDYYDITISKGLPKRQ